ncbi:ankyrin repeat-containing domain protein [Cladorrhinum sp. PSN332]|nr:ankyrin repeat-containing domain protein [Cladorrhinum sp. PSN332]
MSPLDSSSNMPSLLKIPPELLFIICEYPDVADLASLAATSKRQYMHVNDELYRRDSAHKRKALVWGAVTGQIRTMRMALASGTDINTVSDMYSGTALHGAAMLGEAKAIDWLIDNGANPAIGSKSLCSCFPLDFPTGTSSSSSHCDGKEWFEARWYPLHLALCHNQHAAFARLLARGVPLDPQFEPCSCGNVKDPILHRAARMGEVESMELILNCPGTEGMVNLSVPVLQRLALRKTPIEELCYTEDMEHKDQAERVHSGIKTLMSHGAEGVSQSTLESLVAYDWHIQAGHGATPRYYAIASLLELGAYRPEVISPGSVNAMLWQILQDMRFDEVRYHIEHMHQDGTGIYGIDKGFEERRCHRHRLVKQLLLKGAGNVQKTALMNMCQKTTTWDCTDLVPLFLELGNNVDVNDQDSEGMTALHHLVARTQMRWADDAQYPEGPITSVRPVTLRYFREAVEALMSQGARLDIKNKQALTPLDQVEAA